MLTRLTNRRPRRSFHLLFPDLKTSWIYEPSLWHPSSRNLSCLLKGPNLLEAVYCICYAYYAMCMYAFTYFWMQTRTPHNKCQKASRKRVRNAISSCPCYKWWVQLLQVEIRARVQASFSPRPFTLAPHATAKDLRPCCTSQDRLSVCLSVRPSVRLSQSVSKCWRPTHSPAKRYPSESRAGKPAASFFTRRLHNDWQFIMPASSLLGSFKASRSW